MNENKSKWVPARSQCSVDVMFKRLRDEMRIDMHERNEITNADGDKGRFAMRSEQMSFVIHDTWANTRRAVEVRMDQGSIWIDIDVAGIKRMAYRVGVTLPDDLGAACMFLQDDQPREVWQVSKRALEHLFFLPVPEVDQR